MDDSVAYTERLMHLFSQKLASEARMPVGEALRWAKQQYLGTVPSGGFGTYDEKAMIEAGLFGLPMYGVTVPITSGRASFAAPLSVNGLPTDTVSFDLASDLQLETGSPDGAYYSIAGEVQASPGRPVQPRTSQPLPTKVDLTPHGALLVGAVSDRVDDFNPLISRPVTETKLAEPLFQAPAWFPAKPWSVNRRGDAAQLVVVPAQFRGDQDSGTLRRFLKLDFEVYYTETASIDFASPIVWTVESNAFGTEGDFWVDTIDSSGIQRVAMAYTRDGTNWQLQDLAPHPFIADRWQTRMTGLNDQFIYFIQVVDGAGNVTVTSNKGLFFEPTWHEIFLPLLLRGGNE
jgi:hypothetical protein